ncbi:hypothetical protein HanRHA438_Chr10g0465861 [Helianthus annuus]|nr:hypothetical protein HanRHA438_Chr10g0465861 [Helianthus annuus]
MLHYSGPEASQASPYHEPVYNPVSESGRVRPYTRMTPFDQALEDINTETNTWRMRQRKDNAGHQICPQHRKHLLQANQQTKQQSFCLPSWNLWLHEEQ